MNYTFAYSDVVLGGFRIYDSTTDQTARVHIEVSKREYLNGYFTWNYKSDYGDATTTYTLEYEVWVILTNNYKLNTQELSAYCSSNDGSGSCIGQAVLSNAVPTGLQWMGFALQSIDVSADVPGYIAQLNVDASSSTALSLNRRRQNLSCDFITSTATAMSCATRSVAFAGSSDWFDTVNTLIAFSRSNSGQPWNSTSSITAPALAKGVFVGLERLNLAFGTSLPTSTRVQAGCFGPTLTSGTVTFETLLGDSTTPPADFVSDLTCFQGWSKTK